MSFTANIDDVVAENRNRLLGKRQEWKRVRLKEVATILNGYPFESARFKRDTGTPLIRIRDIVPGKTETFYEGDFDPAFVVEHGEILVGMDGDFHCQPWTGERALLNQRVCKIVPDESRYTKQFLRYVLPGYLDAINEQTPSVTVKHLSSRTIADIPLPAPPVEEQKRIVAEIEKQFTRLEAGVAALRRVQASLKRYRAAVLKAACEGRLVPTEAELAKAEKRKFESGEELLARILIERREKWPGSGKYKEPVRPDTKDLPSVPRGWTWASLDQLSGHITSGSRDWSKFYNKGTDTFILAQNVRPMRLDLSERQFVDAPIGEAETERTRVWQDDILVTIVGAKTGDVCRVPTDLEDHFVCQSVALLRPVLSGFVKFIEMYLASRENGQAQWKRYIYGQGRPHLSFEQLRMTAVALPPLAEQARMVVDVERRLSVIEELESVVSTDLQRAVRLRQSILQNVFSH